LNKKIIYILLGTGLFITILFSLGMGAMNIPIKEIIKILLTKTGLFTYQVNDQYEAVLTVVRTPRVIMSVLAGAALGISGAAIQGIFRNPLAEPGLIGISSGASLMSALVITLETTLLSGLSNILGYYLLVFGAFAGAGIAAAIIYQLSKNDGKANITTMLLAGIAINAMAGALTGLVSYMSDEQQLRSITFWMLGSLSGTTWPLVYCAAPFIIFALILLPVYGKKLNAFVLGESQANHIGMRTAGIKWRVVTICTLAVGTTVAVAGIIGFVGLLVPHSVRLIGGVDNRYVLPASALLGAVALTVSDMLARTLVAPLELPIGVITALLGTPVFLYILIRDKKKIVH
jgi:iron complex transport system permease protein